MCERYALPSVASSVAQYLVLLPCGCVFDRDFRLMSQDGDSELIVSCPWCDASFSLHELLLWSSEFGEQHVGLISSPRTLLEIGTDLVELLGFCACGATVTRTLDDDDSREREKGHVLITYEDLQKVTKRS